MPRIKSLSEIAEKFVRRASVSADEYRRGIRATIDWQGPTIDAADNWEQGIQAAIADNLFVKGVEDVSTEEWKRKAEDKGGANYGVGVRASKDDFARGFAPFREIIAGITLPPRGPKGSPENFERVRAIGEALHNAKVQGV